MRRAGTILIAEIQAEVARHYGLSEETIREPADTPGTRIYERSHPRQVAIYLSTKLTRQSLARIGHYFGGRDHSTVLHAVASVQKRANDREAIRVLTKRLMFVPGLEV